MKEGRYTWPKPFDAWLPTAVYACLHFTQLEHHPFVPLKTGLAALITFLANRSNGGKQHPIARNTLVMAAAASVSLLDEIIVPELKDHVRMRYLLPFVTTLAFAALRRKPLARGWNLFLSLNVLFLSVSLAYTSTRSMDFVTEKQPSNRLYDTLSGYLSGNAPITLILADGYPSDSVLAVRFGIDMRLDSLLRDFSYQRFDTRYTSTPVSVANLLFGAVFPDEDAFFEMRGTQTEWELVQKAFDSSSFRTMPAAREAQWLSFIFDEGRSRLLDLPWWKREHFRALFDNLYLRHVDDRCRLDSNISRYNRKILEDYRKTVMDPQAKGRFVFLHLLTFHSFCSSIADQVVYADGLILEAVRLTPESRNIIVFSDHGYREPGMDAKEMRSGILMTGLRR